MARYVLAQNGNSESWDFAQKYFCFLKWCWIIGIDQLTFVYSCRQLGRKGILSIGDSYNLNDSFPRRQVVRPASDGRGVVVEVAVVQHRVAANADAAQHRRQPTHRGSQGRRLENHERSDQHV